MNSSFGQWLDQRDVDRCDNKAEVLDLFAVTATLNVVLCQTLGLVRFVMKETDKLKWLCGFVLEGFFRPKVEILQPCGISSWMFAVFAPLLMPSLR